MLFTSLPQLVVLVILFLGGLFFGLGLHPGGKKWRLRFQEESDNYAQYRRDADGQIRDANRRIGELERELTTAQEREATARRAATEAEFNLAEERHKATLRTVPTPTPIEAPEAAPPTGFAVPVPAPPPPADPAPVIAAAPVVEAEYEPVDNVPVGDEPKKSWFSMGGTPDLGRIRGIDQPLKTRLFGLGVTRFEDITELSDVDEIALEQRLSLPAGYITREQWRDQAALLRTGQDKEHAERFPQG